MEVTSLVNIKISLFKWLPEILLLTVISFVYFHISKMQESIFLLSKHINSEPELGLTIANLNSQINQIWVFVFIFIAIFNLQKSKHNKSLKQDK